MTQQQQKAQEGKEEKKVQPKRHSPWMYGVGGLGFLMFWFLALMMQVQTSEAMLIGGPQVNIFHPNWAIFMQIPDLFRGRLPQDEAKAAMFAWGSEWVLLGCFLGWEEMRSAVAGTGKFLAGCFEFIGLAILAYNFISDFNYGTLGSGWWGQVGFAVLVSFMTMFFAAIGSWFLRLAWHKTA